MKLFWGMLPCLVAVVVTVSGIPICHAAGPEVVWRRPSDMGGTLVAGPDGTVAEVTSGDTSIFRIEDGVAVGQVFEDPAFRDCKISYGINFPYQERGSGWLPTALRFGRLLVLKEFGGRPRFLTWKGRAVGASEGSDWRQCSLVLAGDELVELRGDGSALAWDRFLGRREALTTADPPPQGTAYVEEGRLLVVGTKAGEVVARSLVSGEERWRTALPGVRGFAPVDGGGILAAARDGGLTFIDGASGRVRGGLELEGMVWFARQVGDDLLVSHGSERGAHRVALVEPRRRRLLWSRRVDERWARPGAVVAAGRSEDGIVVGFRQGRVALLSPRDGDLLRAIAMDGIVCDLLPLPGGALVRTSHVMERLSWGTGSRLGWEPAAGCRWWSGAADFRHGDLHATPASRRISLVSAPRHRFDFRCLTVLDSGDGRMVAPPTAFDFQRPSSVWAEGDRVSRLLRDEVEVIDGVGEWARQWGGPRDGGDVGSRSQVVEYGDSGVRGAAWTQSVDLLQTDGGLLPLPREAQGSARRSSATTVPDPGLGRLMPIEGGGSADVAAFVKKDRLTVAEVPSWTPRFDLYVGDRGDEILALSGDTLCVMERGDMVWAFNLSTGRLRWRCQWALDRMFVASPDGFVVMDGDDRAWFLDGDTGRATPLRLPEGVEGRIVGCEGRDLLVVTVDGLLMAVPPVTGK